MKTRYLFLFLFVPIVFTKKDDEDIFKQYIIRLVVGNFTLPNGKVVLETETETWTS